jgi:hypothetical protein
VEGDLGLHRRGGLGRHHGVLAEGEGSDRLLRLREHGRSSDLRRHLVIEEVIGLEVEEALTNVAAHIGLITVETQPLAAAFLLFRM